MSKLTLKQKQLLDDYRDAVVDRASGEMANDYVETSDYVEDVREELEARKALETYIAKLRRSKVNR